MLKTLGSQIKEFKKVSLLTPVFMILEVLMEMMIPLFMASIIDEGVEAGNISHIYKVGILMLIIASIGLLAGIMGGRYGARASTGFARNIRKAMFEKIQTFSFASIDKYATSGLITRLTTDVTNVQNAYQMILRMCVRAPFSLICAMTLAFIIDARLASIYLIAVIFLGSCLFFIMKRTSKYFNQAFQKYDDLNNSVQENISAIRVVKAYVREDYEKSKFIQATEQIYKMFTQAESTLTLNAPLMQITLYSCLLGISYLGAKMIVGTTLTTGELLSLLTYCVNILMSLMMLSMVFVMVTMSLASARRIAQVLNEENNLTSPEEGLKTVVNGDIVFEHVNFSYKEDSKELVLKDINLTIHAGETIGIIGGTGSAKTTLVSLISRLYDVTHGKVLVGGRDVREYDLETLRNKVAVVLQKNVLFSGTILDNLKWGNPEATIEECQYVCELACASDFIEKFPEKYETYIEQGGTNISGGQKQRLCIARALLKQPKVLIFDDSTSAVDTATDQKIREALSMRIPGTTKLIIAQRIASIKNADKIIVLDNGQLNGFGTHEELLKTNVIYKDVYESQTAGQGDFDEKEGEQ